MSAAQAKWIAANYAQIRAMSVGIGSNGYPPPEDGAAFVIFTDNRASWVHVDGREEKT